MVEADTNRIKLSYVKEVTYGASPGTQLTDLRYVSESLMLETSTVQSNEIRSDRQISDIIRVGIESSGDIAGEFSYGSYDEFLRASLMSSAWAAAVTITNSTTSAASGDNSFNDSGSGFGALVVGQWIKASSFSNAANNGYFKIVTKTTAKITVVGGTLVTEAAGAPRTIYLGEQITNGTTLDSFTIEKHFTDLTNIFQTFGGMVFNLWKLEVTKESILTTSFGLLGGSMDDPSATTGTGSNVAVGTTPVFSATDNVLKFFEENVLTSITSCTIDLNNNLRTRQIVGTLGPISAGSGSCNISGTLQLYLANNGMIAKYLAMTTTSVAMIIRDSSLAAYVIELPAIKLTGGQTVAGGQNQDVIADFNFAAFRDATEGVMIRIVRFP